MNLHNPHTSASVSRGYTGFQGFLRAAGGKVTVFVSVFVCLWFSFGDHFNRVNPRIRTRRRVEIGN